MERRPLSGQSGDMKQRHILVVAGAVVTLGLQPAPATAAPTHSFEGSCSVLGVATLTQPVSLVPAPNHVVYRATGRCYGTLDGRRLPATGAPVAYRAEGDKITGCTSTVTQLGAELRFYPRRRRATKIIRLTGELAIVGRNGAGLFHGATSGTAEATVTVQGGRETLEACVAGGMTQTVMSGELLTLGPIVG